MGIEDHTGITRTTADIEAIREPPPRDIVARGYFVRRDVYDAMKAEIKRLRYRVVELGRRVAMQEDQEGIKNMNNIECKHCFHRIGEYYENDGTTIKQICCHCGKIHTYFVKNEWNSNTFGYKEEEHGPYFKKETWI